MSAKTTKLIAQQLILSLVYMFACFIDFILLDLSFSLVLYPISFFVLLRQRFTRILIPFAVYHLTLFAVITVSGGRYSYQIYLESVSQKPTLSETLNDVLTGWFMSFLITVVLVYELAYLTKRIYARFHAPKESVLLPDAAEETEQTSEAANDTTEAVQFGDADDVKLMWHRIRLSFLLHIAGFLTVFAIGMDDTLNLSKAAGVVLIVLVTGLINLPLVIASNIKPFTVKECRNVFRLFSVLFTIILVFLLFSITL